MCIMCTKVSCTYDMLPLQRSVAHYIFSSTSGVVGERAIFLPFSSLKLELLGPRVNYFGLGFNSELYDLGSSLLY
jgi:hypothetical protein